MELVSDNAEYGVVEGEPPELLGRNLASAAHLLASATAFFFLAFVFAYFYLRSLNNAGMWKPKHVDTSITWGTIVTACIVASAIAVRLGLSDHRADNRERGCSSARPERPSRGQPAGVAAQGRRRARVGIARARAPGRRLDAAGLRAG